MPAQRSALLEPQFLRTLEQLGIVSRKIFRGLLKGERRSKKKGVSIEFADYRDYVPGDDLRFLDWNIYGRLERLFIKLFLEEEDLNIYLLVDTSRSMGFGQPEKLLYAKKVAAALGYIALNNLDRVAIGAFQDNLTYQFPLTRGKRMVWKLFQFLDDLQAQGATCLAPSCRRFVMHHRHKGMALLISDFLDPQGYEAALKFYAARQLDLFVLHVLAPEEVQPTLVGDLRLVDSESGTYTDITISEQLLSRYRKTVNGFQKRLASFCRSLGIYYLYTTTNVPFENLILRYLREVGLLR